MSISATNSENQETNQDFVQVTPQLLDSNKQAQARANIGALAKDDVSKLIQHVELNADKNLQLKFADGSVEVVSLSELLLNRLQLKGVVDTYEDLATITNPKANDAYQVMEDSLVYIYTNSGFQTKGKGFNISLIPNGTVAEGIQGAVSGNEVYNSIKINKSNLFTNPELIPLIYQSATKSILEIKIYSNNLIGYYAQVVSVNSNGTISVVLRSKNDNSILANSRIDVGVNSLIEVTTNINRGYGYNVNLNYWIEYLIDLTKIVPFSTSVTDTKVNVNERLYLPITKIDYFDFFNGFPVRKSYNIIDVIKKIEVTTSLNLNLRIQSVTNNNIIFYDVNDNNKSYAILKTNSIIQPNGFYELNQKIDGNVEFKALIDFNSVNTENQFATAANTYLYLKSNVYNSDANISTNNIFISSFDDNLQGGSYKAIKQINIFTNDFEFSYSVQAIRLTGEVLVIYKRDKNRLQTSAYSINENERVFLTDTIWHYDGYKNGMRIKVLFDNSLVGTQFGNTNDIGSDIDFKNYNPIDVFFTKTREYCNLGASTSGGPWHIDSVRRCNMNWRSFNVGSATWAVREGATLNTGEYTSGSLDNNAFNQIAKLNLAKANEDYYPDVIGCMFGLTDAQTPGTVVGTFEDAMSADVSGYTAENWQDTAPENYRKNTAVCIKAAIYFLSKNFPYSQVVFYTVQQTNSPAYSTENVLKINELIRRLSKEFSIQCIDLGAETGIDGRLETGNIFISGDLVHPNTAGINVMRRYLTKKLQEVVFYKR